MKYLRLDLLKAKDFFESGLGSFAYHATESFFRVHMSPLSTDALTLEAYMDWLEGE